MTTDQTIALGMQHHRAGELREAEALYQQVLAKDPNNPDALHLLGVIARQNEDLELAAKLMIQAIAVKPNVASFQSNLCDVLLNLDRVNEAIAAGQRAIMIDPNFAPAHANLGNALKSAERLDEAVAAYRAAGNLPAAQNGLGKILRDRGDLREAIDVFTAALRTAPNFEEAQVDLLDTFNKLARSLQDEGKHEEAIAVLEQALNLPVVHPDVFNNLGNAFNSLNRKDEALAAYRRAVEVDPSFHFAHNNIGAILTDRGDHAAAMEALQEAVRLQPNMAVAWTNLGNALRSLGRLDESLAAEQKAVELWPEFGEAHANLANTFRDLGLIREAQDAYRKAVELRPDLTHVHSNALFALYFDPEIDPEEIIAAHQRWATQYADHLTPAQPSFPNSRDPDRRLKIGYVSPDFRTHPIAQFLKPLFTAHDREQVHITCYSDVVLEDAVTGELKSMADEWRDMRGVVDSQVAEQVRRDQIDILVDLALHTAGNRLPTFARKPAPLQVSYLGYPGTTGLAAMDYRFTDVGSSRVDLQACKLEYSIVSPK